jgi:hypothetical protein
MNTITNRYLRQRLSCSLLVDSAFRQIGEFSEFSQVGSTRHDYGDG